MLVAAYVALFLCFAITNFTNGVILGMVRSAFHLGSDWPPADSALVRYSTTTDYYPRFLLVSIKDSVFFGAFVVLLALIWRSFPPLWPLFRQRRLWIDVLIGLAIASTFIVRFWPISMGSVYALNSADPFLQEPGSYNRRILLPLLAHWLHLGGFAYAIFYWLIVLLACVLTGIWFELKGLVLSRLELASLYTVGIFATALGLPGFVEIMVLVLTLLALLDFERHDRTSLVQPILFGLGLLTHDAAAVLAFGVLALCRFDRRFLLHYVALLGLYAIVWLGAVGFSLTTATRIQSAANLSDIKGFILHFDRVILSVLVGYKLTLLAAGVAVLRLARARDYRNAALILLAIGGGAALCVLATDYGRFVAFGSFALLFALPLVLPALSNNQRRAFAIANLALPTFYVVAHHSVAYRGLYGLFLTNLFDMRT